MNNKIRLELTIEQAEELLMQLDQCMSEGYIDSGNPLLSVIDKLRFATDK